MRLIIERTVNGYVVTDDGGEKMVFQEPDEWNAAAPEAHAARHMLWYVNEAIGVVGSRYDEWRVRITLEHGDKWISPEEHKALLADV